MGGGEAAHARARRLAKGDAVILVDGTGRQAEARVTGMARGRLEARVERVQPARQPPAAVVLLAAAVRAERLSWIVEKATELDASRVVIVRAERTQAFRAGEGVRARLERVAREAAKQCEAARWPRIEGPRTLAEAIDAERAPLCLFLDPEGEPLPAGLEASEVCLAVGPEGGWNAAERQAARERGWSIVRLPAGVLRAETAAVAGLVLVRAALERGKVPTGGAPPRSN